MLARPRATLRPRPRPLQQAPARQAAPSSEEEEEEVSLGTARPSIRPTHMPVTGEFLPPVALSPPAGLKEQLAGLNTNTSIARRNSKQAFEVIEEAAAFGTSSTGISMIPIVFQSSDQFLLCW